MKNTDSIVDKFVGTLSQEGINIGQSKNINWIDNFISIFPAKYAPSFMSLITRYTFDEFTADKITFYANGGNSEPHGLRNAILKDRIIFTATSANGFLHFTRSADGSYDPICFDVRNRRSDKEYPVVRLDHEEILQFERIKIVEILYSSLAELMKAYAER
jgi:hypothetical protein